jgi:hypothetical protein
MRKLYKITIETDDDNFYRLKPDNDSVSYGAKEFVFKADDLMLKNFLRRCKISDDTVQPRSYRAITYNEILNIIKNQNGCVYCFRHHYPKTQQELEGILR